MKNILVVISAVVFLAAGGCEKNALTNSLGSAGKTTDTAAMRDEAMDIVRSALRDENPVVRSNAIEVVSTAKVTELMDLVETLLSDDVVPARFAAAMAVGDMKYGAARDKVAPLLKDTNGNVKVAAAYAMQRLGAGSYPQIYAAGLASENQTVRANTAMVVGKLGDRAAIPKLKELLHDPKSADKVRFQAVEAMAMLGDEQAYDRLWAMLISTYADDRVMGIRGMGALNTMPARNALVTVLDDSVVEVRLAAAEQLAAMGEPETGLSVVRDFFEGKKVTSEERYSVRAEVLAAMAIGRIDTPDLTKYLPDLLKNPAKPVKLAAAKSVLILQGTREAR